MDTAPLKSFATSARTELIREVGARIIAVLPQGSPERVEQPRAVAALERAIARAGGGDKGKAHVADKVAYTWFNRIIALRFMDANGYTGIGVVSPAADQVGQPEVLAAAKRGQIDGGVVRGTDAATITGLLNGTRPPRTGTDAQAEAYALLLTDYCRYWNSAMPFIFEREGDYTELLIPANLLAEDSALSRSVKVLTQDVCRDVEVIGWLYQFYISERKDEVFAGFKKNKKAGADEIPAATQLFTPHWIVRYLLENSVGRLWMLNRPESRLVDQMDYYIAPVDEETDFLEITTPEELKVIDPACGSGHMLTYAFDLLYEIYEEEGYTPSQIPGLILTNNLYGTEIDPRAGALAAFALTMKAAAKRKLFLKNAVEPNICVLEPITFAPHELDYLVTKDGDRHAEEAFWNQFAEADTFGSLIQPNPDLTVRLAKHLATLDGDGDGDLLGLGAVDRAQRIIDQATCLTRDYAVVVANPPYMGSKQMNALLSQFMKDEYPDVKSDLFAGFIERCTNLAGPRGAVAMITMQSWMFLSSYEKLRASLLTKQRIASMLHLGARAFDSIGGEVVSSTAFVLVNVPTDNRGAARKQAGTFIRLVDGTSEAEKIAALSAALEVRAKDAGLHLASDADFAAIPGSPIVYWLSEKIRATFRVGKPLGEVSSPLVGLRTGDNARFMRLWWEVASSRSSFACDSLRAAETAGARWFPYNKGGAFRRWYGNHEYVVNWERDGREIEEELARRYPYLVPAGKTLVRGQGRDRYFSPSVSWSDISSGAPSFRHFPKGFIHGNKGNSIFGPTSLQDRLLAVMNAPCATVILEALTPTMTASVGDVAKTPVPDAIADLPPSTTQALVATAKSDWDEFETSWGFERNPLIAAFGGA
ncbi:BREX-1 system adenine-specific DNA-methyltransferase PglX [Nocardia sp. NPDC058666]|uniref:BREX-1 system adenine-specific DNA-methyltransferase PglX n=1 Tax=Nocardia sp. NPDC058666 TaxID=3346587 RepID=UPI0036669BF4